MTLNRWKSRKCNTNYDVVRYRQTTGHLLQIILPNLLHWSSAYVQREVWFMQIVSIRHALCKPISLQSFSQGRYDVEFPLLWSSCSPNLNPLDFFWDHLKSVIYETPDSENRVYCSINIRNTSHNTWVFWTSEIGFNTYWSQSQMSRRYHVLCGILIVLANPPDIFASLCPSK